MITFTKEQLIASAHARIEFAEMMLAGELEPLKERTWSIELELARIALASLEAEHAGFIVKHKITGKFGSWLHSKADWFRSDEYEVLSAYTAPPATVSMKDHQIRDLVNELRDISVEYHGTQQLRERIARTIRAAMLQGAELVTTANKLPDGWVACSERMPEESGRYWCYVEEQNDLGKSHYQWNCSWNGERWWVESENGGRVTHWMPLPAAPQQEVK